MKTLLLMLLCVAQAAAAQAPLPPVQELPPLEEGQGVPAAPAPDAADVGGDEDGPGDADAPSESPGTPTPADEQDPERVERRAVPLDYAGGVWSAAAALGVSAAACAPLALVAGLLVVGPVLAFVQGPAANLWWMAAAGLGGGALALLLGTVGPMAMAVILGAVGDSRVGGRSRLFMVLGASVAGAWGACLLAVAVLGAASLVMAGVVAPWLNAQLAQRAQQRQLGFSSEMLAVWAGTSVAGVALVLAVGVLVAGAAAVPPVVADLLTRVPNFVTPPHRTRLIPGPAHKAPRRRIWTQPAPEAATSPGVAGLGG